MTVRRRRHQGGRQRVLADGCWQEFLEATPTAELLPLSAGVQDDESENEHVARQPRRRGAHDADELCRMGLTYEELSMFGILRKVDKLGPWSCYLRLLGLWKGKEGMGPVQIAEKVMRFFRHYAVNRHKATIITPSIHLSAYSE